MEDTVKQIWHQLGGTFLPQYLISNIINPAPPQKNPKQQIKPKHQQTQTHFHLSGRPRRKINCVLCLYIQSQYRWCYNRGRLQWFAGLRNGWICLALISDEERPYIQFHCYLVRYVITVTSGGLKF